MKVFISYSTTDLELVKKIDSTISSLVATHYWDKSKEYGEKDWEKIYSWIDVSDLVVVILSEASKDNPSVRTEIGRAQAKGKPIIPLVSDKLSSDDLGSLRGITYVKYNEESPEFAHSELFKAISEQKNKFEKGQGALGLAVISLIIYVLSRK